MARKRTFRLGDDDRDREPSNQRDRQLNRHPKPVVGAEVVPAHHELHLFDKAGAVGDVQHLLVAPSVAVAAPTTAVGGRLTPALLQGNALAIGIVCEEWSTQAGVGQLADF